MNRVRALLREPLVHFLIAGLALFAFFALRAEEADPASRTITISEAQVSALAARWSQTWKRAPTKAEIDGLIRDYIEEEVYYREGLRLGLDQDDPIIRRRMRSKMAFLATSELENAPPSEAELRAWVSKQPTRYASGARISFDQIYLGAEGAHSKPVLDRLGKGADWRTLGQIISLPSSIERADVAEIARTFGAAFADDLSRKSAGEWSGPIPSGFGAHLVRVRVVKPGNALPFADIRKRAENDWRAETLKVREARAYQTLLDSYTIRIERP